MNPFAVAVRIPYRDGRSRERGDMVPRGAQPVAVAAVRRAPRAAEDDAFAAEMYRRYRAPLMCYVLRLTAGDRQHAEDVVAEALRALSPAHREVLNETILRDRTVNEAAEVLGVPVGTVKSRVYYALRALRVVLAERGVPLECELVAVSRAGERRVAAGWLVPAAGYGVPGHPGHLDLAGGTSIPLKDLAHVEVDVVHGRTLLTIPV